MMNTTVEINALAQNLSSLSMKSPEFYVFNEGATLKELKRLENQLKLKIPAELAFFLSHVNGGFISAQGKINLNDPADWGYAKEQAHVFLSCKEIVDCHGYLSRQQLHWDSIDVFPWIPVMRLTDGTLMVIDSRKGGALLKAKPEEEVSAWVEECPSMEDLVRHYADSEGLIPWLYQKPVEKRVKRH